MLIISPASSFSLIPSREQSSLVGPDGASTNMGFTAYRWLSLSLVVPDANFSDVVISAVKQGAVGLSDAATFASRLHDEVDSETARRTEALKASNDALNQRWHEAQAQCNVLYGENVTLRQAFVALTGHDVAPKEAATGAPQ